MADEAPEQRSFGTDLTPVRSRLENRRFSDEEVAELLNRAVQMQEAAPSSGGRAGGGGLSLEDVRQVAAEAGIDPHYIELAAGALATADQHEQNWFIGGEKAWHLTRSVEGYVPESERARIVGAIRSVMGGRGVVTDIYGRMEWTFNDGLGPVNVGMVNRDGRTELDVTTDRSGEVGLIMGVGIPVGGLLIGGILIKSLGLSGPAGLAAVLGSASGIWVATRALWGSLSRRWRRKLERLSDVLASAASRAALASGHDESEG